VSAVTFSVFCPKLVSDKNYLDILTKYVALVNFSCVYYKFRLNSYHFRTFLSDLPCISFLPVLSEMPCFIRVLYKL
jgi:hypothetical protein